MTKIDSFLRSHDIDVGRTFAICGLLTVFVQICSVVGDLLVGRLSINLGIPFGVIVALGLWGHKPWARIIAIVCFWLATIFLSVLVVLIFVGAPGDYSLTFGTTVFRHPNPWQASVFGMLMLPMAYLALSALHSGKAREEFRLPNKATDRAFSSGPPSSGLRSGHP